MSYQDYMMGYRRQKVAGIPNGDYKLGVEHCLGAPLSEESFTKRSARKFHASFNDLPAADMGAQREKLNDIPYDLVPYQEFTDAYVRVAEFGAKKYAPWNWSKGLSRRQILCSLLRHTFSYLRGEDRDKDSGLLHTDHITWNAVALSHNVHHSLEDGRRVEPPREYLK